MNKEEIESLKDCLERKKHKKKERNPSGPGARRRVCSYLVYLLSGSGAWRGQYGARRQLVTLGL
jgi:hypothetical protein